MLGRNMPKNEAWASFSGSFLRYLKCFRLQKTDVKMACKSALRFLVLRSSALHLAFRRCRMLPEGLISCQIAFSYPRENPVFP